MNEQEIWAPVALENFKCSYEVSTTGKVRSIERYRYFKDNQRVKLKSVLLKAAMSEKGYHQVILRNSPHNRTIKIHQLVALTFVPNPDSKPFVNHKDGNKLNNCVENLEWVTHSENMLHCYWVTKRMKQSNPARPINQFDAGGNVVKTWPSMQHIRRELGYTLSPIRHCLLGAQKTSRGYAWKYAD